MQKSIQGVVNCFFLATIILYNDKGAEEARATASASIRNTRVYGRHLKCRPLVTVLPAVA